MIDVLWWVLVVTSPILIVLFILRFIFTWYPEIQLNRFPYSLIVWPTELVLKPTRKVIPPFGGVDMTAMIWVAIIALVQELLVAQQGLLTMFKSAGHS